MLLRLICALFCFVALPLANEGLASAQPGAQPAAQPGVGNYGPPRPAPVRLQLQFTLEELEILDRGHISTGEYIIGAALGSYFGFGLGHMVQQRWNSDGWIFTLGQLGTGGVLLYSVLTCSVASSDFGDGGPNSTLLGEDGCPYKLAIASGLAWAGFRLWEIVDLWAGPPEHNRRLRRLQRHEQPQRYGFAIVPTGSGSGVASLSLNF